MASRLVARPRLMGLLAAHFEAADQGRLDRLQRLLRSVEAQTVRVPLLVSWSCEDSPGGVNAPRSLTTQAQEVFREFAGRGVLHALPPLQGRRAQFQHYFRLRQTIRHHLRPGESPWVFFSDDDDIWHPHRSEEYLAAMSDRPEVEVVASRLHISPGFGPRLPSTATAADVSELHRKGSLRLAVGAEKTEPGLFGTAMGEYFDTAVAFPVLDRFFAVHNEAVLRNRFADIRFRTFVLKWPGGAYRFMPREGPNGDPTWMYYYDRPTEPYSIPPDEEDLQYLSDELPDLKKIAGMRQTLDCVLFQLTPTQGPFRITERQFAEQLVGMLVQQGPATVAMALDRCRLHGVEVVREVNI